MSSQLIQYTKYGCDCCGKEDITPVRKIEIVMKQFQEFNSTVYFEPRYNLPYGMTDGDICDDCFKLAITYLQSDLLRKSNEK